MLSFRAAQASTAQCLQNRHLPEHWRKKPPEKKSVGRIEDSFYSWARNGGERLIGSKQLDFMHAWQFPSHFKESDKIEEIRAET